MPPNRAGAGSSYLGENDKIEITLREFNLSDAKFDSDTDLDLIEISDSGITTDDAAHPTAVEKSADSLILTLPALGGNLPAAHEYLIVTIGKGTGILTPETPKGFDDSDEGYKVAITLIDENGSQDNYTTEDENIVVVKNPVNSPDPSAFGAS